MTKKLLLMGGKESFILLFLLCSLLLSFGYYLEFYYHIVPCPLCMTQRICFYLISLFSLIALVKVKQTAWCKTFFSLIAAIASLGAIMAARQIWLQHLPKDQVPACGPDLSYLIQEFPLRDVMLAMFTGDGNCAEIEWVFLGLSIPSWTLIVFILIILFCLYQRTRYH